MEIEGRNMLCHVPKLDVDGLGGLLPGALVLIGKRIL